MTSNPNDLADLGPMTVRPIPWPRFRAEVMATYATSSRKHRGSIARTFASLESIDLAEEGQAPRRIETTADLTVLLVAKYLQMQPPSLSPYTLYNHVGAVRTLCSIAEQQRYIVISPFRLRKLSKWVRLPRYPAAKRHASKEEIRAVLEVMRQDTIEKRGWAQWRARRLYALTATVAYTGMRAGEAQRMWVEDLDLSARIIHVRPHERRLKTIGSEEPIGIPAALVPILSDWLAHRLDHPVGFAMPSADRIPWMFPGAFRKSPWTGGPPSHRPVGRLKAVALRAGVGDIHWQMLRRSWATHAEANGVPEALITRQLRHSDPEVTRRFYRKADMKNLAAATETFDF